MLEDAEVGDPRAQALILERAEGRVPLPVQADEATPGVVLLPAEKLEADAWERLAAATLQGQGYAPPEQAATPRLIAEGAEREKA